jgi:hypothetical protein
MTYRHELQFEALEAFSKPGVVDRIENVEFRRKIRIQVRRGYFSFSGDLAESCAVVTLLAEKPMCCVKDCFTYGRLFNLSHY